MVKFKTLTILSSLILFSNFFLWSQNNNVSLSQDNNSALRDHCNDLRDTLIYKEKQLIEIEIKLENYRKKVNEFNTIDIENLTKINSLNNSTFEDPNFLNNLFEVYAHGVANSAINDEKQKCEEDIQKLENKIFRDSIHYEYTIKRIRDSIVFLQQEVIDLNNDIHQMDSIIRARDSQILELKSENELLNDTIIMFNDSIISLNNALDEISRDTANLYSQLRKHSVALYANNKRSLFKRKKEKYVALMDGSYPLKKNIKGFVVKLCLVMDKNDPLSGNTNLDLIIFKNRDVAENEIVNYNISFNTSNADKTSTSNNIIYCMTSKNKKDVLLNKKARKKLFQDADYYHYKIYYEGEEIYKGTFQFYP